MSAKPGLVAALKELVRVTEDALSGAYDEYETREALEDGRNALARAVNAHDELVAALEAIVLQACQGPVLERDACITQARAALAKARGEPA